MRGTVVEKTVSALQKRGFSVNSFLQYNSCFDLAAKRAKEIFLIKIFENIDSMREEQALELKRIAAAFNATAVVVGEKTKAFSLKGNVVYSRYGLPVITTGSFEALLENKLPEVRFFKGKETVRIDARKLKEKRKQLGLSLSELAEKIDSSVQAVSRYETDARSSLANAKKLESALGERLITSVDIFEKKPFAQKIFDEQLHDDSFEKIQRLGLQLALFEHAPFRAYSKPEETLLIDKGYSKQDLKRKAMALENAKKIVRGHSVIISKETKYKAIQNTPIIQEEELDSFSKARDLLETIHEREKKRRT